MYSCVERARIHKRSRQTRWLHFDGYSRKSAYRAVGKRGDPLKIVLYRVFIDIARENATTGPCTYCCNFDGGTDEKHKIPWQGQQKRHPLPTSRASWWTGSKTHISNGSCVPEVSVLFGHFVFCNNCAWLGFWAVPGLCLGCAWLSGRAWAMLGCLGCAWAVLGCAWLLRGGSADVSTL